MFQGRLAILAAGFLKAQLPKLTTWAQKKAAKEAGKQGKKVGRKLATVAERFSGRAESAMATWAVRGRPITIGGPAAPGGAKTYWYGGKPNLALRTLMNGTWSYLYPRSKKSAFASGFIRGTFVTTQNVSVSAGLDILLSASKTLSKSRVYASFLRSGANTYKSARAANIKVNRFSALTKSYKTARKEGAKSSRVYKQLIDSGVGSDEAQQFYLRLSHIERSGYITGRLGTGTGAYYGLVDEETRQKRIDQFRSTFRADVKKVGRTWVDAHMRDGKMVRGHWRTIPA